MLGEIPKSWIEGRRDDAARNELVRTLREVSELDAGRAVIDLLKHGVSTDSIWEGLFATAAELVLRRPTVVPVHAQTVRQRVPPCVPARANRIDTAPGAPAVGRLHAGVPAPRSQRATRSAGGRARASHGHRRRCGSVARRILRAAARSHLGRSQGIALPAAGRLRGRVRRERAPAPRPLRPALPRLQVHGGGPREPPEYGAHRVAGPDPVRLDSVLHRIRDGTEPGFRGRRSSCSARGSRDSRARADADADAGRPSLEDPEPVSAHVLVEVDPVSWTPRHCSKEVFKWQEQVP